MIPKKKVRQYSSMHTEQKLSMNIFNNIVKFNPSYPFKSFSFNFDDIQSLD